MTAQAIVPKEPQVTSTETYATNTERLNTNTQDKSKTKIIVVALAVIPVVTGFYILLASTGVDLGPLNALSALTLSGAVGITITSTTLLVATVIWMVAKKKRTTQNQTGSYFTCDIVDKARYGTEEWLKNFSSEHRDGTNLATLIRSVRYAANYVSMLPNRDGSRNTTPNITAASPIGEQQKQLFYDMVSLTNSRLVIGTNPMIIDTDHSPSLLRGKGSYSVNEQTKINHFPAELGFQLTHLEIEDHEEEKRKCTQIVPSQMSITESPKTLILAIAEIKNCIDKLGILINEEHPMIVHSPTGRGSGDFLLLYHLLTRLEETGGNVDAFVGPKFSEQVRNLAEQIESQTVKGAATTMADFFDGALHKPEKGDEQLAEPVKIKELFNMYLSMRS